MADKTIKDPNMELVPHMIPFDPDPNAEKQVFYSYNFKNYLIKKGTTVMIPRGLKEIIDDQSQANRNAARFIVESALKEPQR